MSAINGKESKAVRRKVVAATNAALMNEQATRARVEQLERGTDQMITVMASHGERVDALEAEQSRARARTAWDRVRWLVTGR